MIFFQLNNIDIVYFADDTTAYACYVNLEAAVLEKLDKNSELVIIWFEKTS